MNTIELPTTEAVIPAAIIGAPPSPPTADELPKSKTPRWGVYIALAAALSLGLAAGVHWHAPLAGLVGMHPHDHAADVGGNQASALRQLWTCSMHPQVIREEPGPCPICQMALTPIKSNTVAVTGALAGTVTIDPVIVQNMGVRVAPVTIGELTRDVRAVGYLEEAQPNARDVNLRVSGWVEKLYADTVGMALSKGAPLFDLYSPEVEVATEELIAARRSVEALGPAGDAMARKTSQGLLDATRMKLEQWGLDSREVERLAKLDRPPRTVTFTSPIDGYLTQKMLVQGASVKAGDTVLRIVDLSTVWLDSQVYAQDLPFVRLGRSVTATVDGVPGKHLEGEVIFIQPELDPQTRTAIVRIALPNTDLALRPGMYATARIRATLTDRAVLVPKEAVIDTGTRQIAFVAAGAGRFEPRQIRVGADGEGGVVQVLEGLAPGETVVTSGQFLLDAESRMREAIQKHLDGQLLVHAPSETKNVAVVPSAAPSNVVAPTTVVVAPVRHDHMAHEGHSMAAEAVWSPEADRLFESYFAVQKSLGITQQADAPLEVAALVAAARALVNGATDSHAKAQAGHVLDAALALQGKDIAEQRKSFKALSDAAIALAKLDPPSDAVAAKLYIAFCPMAPGDGARWLQTTDKIANPYFAAKMKECGSIEQTIDTVSRKQ